jgi:hypothetical protein
MKRAAGLMSKGNLVNVVTAVSVVTVAALPPPVSAWPATGPPDTQLWTELDAVARLDDQFSVTGIGQLRLSETLSNPTLTALGADLNYKEGPWTFAIGYRHQVSGHESTDPTVTQVALIMGTRQWKIDRSTILVRVRVENTITASSNPWRLRLRGEYRWAPEGWGVVEYLYANDEVFYKFENDEWFRNRFQAGANLKLTRRTELKVYYQRQDETVGHPGAINALGLLAVMNFE